MAAAVLFRLEIYTPYRLFFADSVEALVLTLIDGEAGIYAGHALLSAPVIPCLLRIKDSEGNWKTAFTAEGILEVTNHKTVLMSDSAEWGHEIDRDRAMKARDKAFKIINSGTFKAETDNALLSLNRAGLRLKASETENKQK